jgi:hypothetical protein
MPHRTASARRPARTKYRGMPREAMRPRADPPAIADNSLTSRPDDEADETATQASEASLASLVARLRLLVWWYLVRFDARPVAPHEADTVLANLIRHAASVGLDRTEPSACDWDGAIERYLITRSDTVARAPSGRGMSARRRSRSGATASAGTTPPRATAQLLNSIREDLDVLERLATADDAQGRHHG